LVTHVADDVDATVAALCDGIRMGAPAAVRATKRLLREVPGLPRDEAFEHMRRLSDELFAGSEAAEGIAAYLEKRRPSWLEG
jgi:enoyl-CoA hydratase/carnithine racemase